MIWFASTVFVLSLLVIAGKNAIYPIFRQEERISEDFYRYAPYAVNLSFYASGYGVRNYTVALDTYSKYFVFICCPFNPPNMTICLNVSTCEEKCEVKEDGECLHHYKFYQTFRKELKEDDVKKDKTYKVEVEKNFDLPVSSFKIGKDDYDYIKEVEVVYTLNYIVKNVQGIMGLSYSFLKYSFNTLFYNAYQFGDRLLLFDIFPYDTGEGRFILGRSDVMNYVFEEYPNDTISWSQYDYTINKEVLHEYYNGDYLTNIMIENRFSSANTIRHMFTIFDLKVCDSSMLGFYSGSWQVVINTNIEGLALPFEFYKTIEEYIDWDLFHKKNYTLPYLTFKLGPEEDSKVFSFPLDLLYEPGKEIITKGPDGNITSRETTDDVFHLYHRGPVTSIYDLFIDGTPFIHFGTRVLERFVTVLDWDKHRVGLIEKPYAKYYNYTTFNVTTNMTTWHSNIVDQVKCVEEKECTEFQFRDQSINDCLNPQCELYIFQRSDDEGRCVVRIEFVVMMLIIIIMFAVVDYTILEAYNCYSYIFTKKFKRNPIMG